MEWKKGALLRVGFVVWTLPWSIDLEAVDDWSVELLPPDPHPLGYRPRIVHADEARIEDETEEGLKLLAGSLTLSILHVVKHSPRFALLRQRMMEADERKKAGVQRIPLDEVTDRDYEELARRLGVVPPLPGGGRRS